jgi:FKBP-type peptidyl-prolyl cis-trans isomerase FklB
MKRIGIAVLALGLWAGAASSQDAPAAGSKPAQTPSPAPAKAPAKAAKPAATVPAQTQQAQAPGSDKVLTTQKDKVSYAIGMETGKGLKAQGLDVDPALVVQGLTDSLSGAKAMLSDDELNEIVKGLQQQIREKQMKAIDAAAAENKKKGEAFLAENAKKDGVTVLPDGLQYKILTAGDGKRPSENDTVMCNYKGTFIDGSEFDSSAKAGKPVPFPVKGVIPGFREVLQLMPVGSKWQVFIPSNLAYGERGAGQVIGPNSTLIFEIDLVSIQAPQAAQGTQGSPTNQ